MIDGARLQTPVRDGEVLVVPESSQFMSLAEANRRGARMAHRAILGHGIAEWRQQTRQALIGSDDRLVVVTGHQPSFIHPGVWAKQIVARRFAAACGGSALNMVIDSDGIDRSTLAIPTVIDGRVELRHVPLPYQHEIAVYEQACTWNPSELSSFDARVRDAAGDRYAGSFLPQVVAGLREAIGERDAVDQWMRALAGVDRELKADVPNVRISRTPIFPLLADMILNAERFATSYNRALAWYRVTFTIRGIHRPIPDLVIEARRCEIAAWVYRDTGPRRRLFVERAAGQIHFFAEDEEIGDVAASKLSDNPDLLAAWNGWRIRPRALATTAWARLLLADLFIHGIGGAKYDRVTDRLLADYYGVADNAIACVSATLWLDLPRSEVTTHEIQRRRRAVRDWKFNPQRAAANEDRLDSLFQKREAAVRSAVVLRDQSPQDRPARKQAFQAIRAVNAAIAGAAPAAGETLRNQLRSAEASLAHDQVARGRDYFMGLYNPSTLRRLLQTLPAESDFRV